MDAKGKETSEVSRTPLKIYSQKDLLRIFPFRSTKLKQLLAAGVLPVVKVGRSYLSSDELIQRWLLDNVGKTIYY